MREIEPMNLIQVRHIGLEVLNRELGAVATVRFLQQFELGQGDYTKERHEWLKDITVNGITKEIKQKRTSR